MLETGGVAYGAMMSYLPIVALLKSHLRVEDRDTPREVADKLRRVVLALDPSLEPALPALAALLDAPVDDREWMLLDSLQRRRRTLDAVPQLLLRASRERPLLLLFEDLQWIDGGTQTVLDGLADRVPAVPLLVVVTYRPEYRHGWASKAQYAQLRLENLPALQASEMLQALLGEDISLESLTPMLAARAGGNPLFLEESVRGLVETGALAGERGAYRLVTGVDTVQVPPTVQAVLAARIGRLPAADRSLLHTTAVIGKDVPFDLLRAVVDVPDVDLREALGRLQDAELLYETRVFPDPEYAFKHALTHDVAYRSVLQERRRVLHVRIVAAIERLHAGRLAEHLERLAHHSLKGEMWGPAVRYLRQAGAKSAERHAASEASLWFEQALTALTNLPETASTLEQAVDIRLERMPMLQLMGDYRLAHEHLREVERLAEDLGDDRRRGRVYRFKANLCNHLSQLDAAVAWGTRALEIAERLEDVRLRAATTTNLEQTYFLRGEYERVIDLAKTNLAAVPADAVFRARESLIPTSVYDRGWLAWSLAEVGRFVEAEEPAATGLRIAEQTRQPYAIGWACYCAGNLNMGRGNWVVARRLYERSIETLQEAGVRHTVPDIMAALAWALARLGELAAASDLAQKAAPLVESAHAQWRKAGVPWSYVWLGHTYARLGRFDDAEAVVPRVLEPRTARFEAFASHLLAEIARRRGTGTSATAEGQFRGALALADRCGMRPLTAHCHLGLGKINRRTGNREQADAHLATATTMYREMDMPFWLEKVEAELRASS
jgi:tetratricopeptide (TPR) repeat protein